MTWDPQSNTAGLIVGFGIMLISGLFLYLDYLTYKEFHRENAKRWWLWDMIFDTISPLSGGILSKIGGFLLGLLIVVLITLQFFGVIH